MNDTQKDQALAAAFAGECLPELREFGRELRMRRVSPQVSVAVSGPRIPDHWVGVPGMPQSLPAHPAIDRTPKRL